MHRTSVTRSGSYPGSSYNRAIDLILLISLFFCGLLIPSNEGISNELNLRQEAVRMCAEWEPALGTLTRWPLGIPSALVVELAEDDSLYVLVENPSQQQ
jgi:hypothetical protein